MSDTPPTTDALPAPSDAALRAALRLMLISGIGPITRKALVEFFGSPQGVLAAPVSELRKVAGIGPKLASSIFLEKDKIDVDDELRVCREHQISILVEGRDDYPTMLAEIHDPPGALFVKGQLVPQDSMSVAIVGTRHATQYGLQQAERLASGLARAGITVVSGLARGIDAAAHRGALTAGGRTIAVLGSGLLEIYPPEHKDLAQEIASHGAVVSESPPRMKPMSGLFPQRNRIITGLSLGVIVVEAPLRSGAILSTTHATEQGREVFAVPGRVDSRASHGCHQLIRDGAKLVESVDDVLEELGPLVKAMPTDEGRSVRHPAELKLSAQEQTILNAIGDQPTQIDDVAAASQLPINRVLATISVLEMRRLIRRVSGSLVVRV